MPDVALVLALAVLALSACIVLLVARRPIAQIIVIQSPAPPEPEDDGPRIHRAAG